MKKQQLHEALAVLLTKLSSARDNPLLMDNYVVKALRTVLLEFKESGELYAAYKEQIHSTMESDNPWIGMLMKSLGDEGYEYTNDDSAKFAEVNEYFFNQKQKTEKYFKELADKEVEVAIEAVDEKELFKAAKDCGLKFADMENLEVVIG